MSITPLDMRNANFNTTMRGYSRDEVDEYLQGSSESLELALQEKAELQQALSDLQEKHDRLAELEDDLKSTLLDAKQTANSILKNAQEDAKKILADAQADAESLESDSQRQVAQMRERVNEISEVRDEYHQRLKSVISSHLEILDDLNSVESNLADDERDSLQKDKIAAIEIDLSSLDLQSEISEEEIAESRTIEAPIAEVAPVLEADSTGAVEEESAPLNQADISADDSDSQPEIQEQSAKKSVSEVIAQITKETEALLPKAAEEPLAEKAVDKVVVSESEPVEAKAQEPEDSDSANKTDPELYRKVVEAREDKGVPTPIKPKKSFSGDLTGPDGIVVFGRREDREKAIVENAKVLSELDSVVDQFAEQLGESKSA